METATSLEWFLFVVIAVAAVTYVWLLADAALDLGWAHEEALKFSRRDFTTIINAGRGQVHTRVLLSLVQIIYLVMAITLLLTAPAAREGPPPPPTTAGYIVRWGLIGSELLLVWLGLHLRATARKVRQGVQERGGD